MQQNFLSLALTKLSLFQSPSGSNSLLQSINLITGISVAELMHAERRIQKTGTLAPLRELLSNPSIQRAEKFKFKISMKQIHKGKATAREQVASRFLLEISTSKGCFDVEVMMVVKRRLLNAKNPHQSAEIQLNYVIQQGNEIRYHTKKLRIADRVPIWRNVQPTSRTTAAFAA
jgi:hypothetical protein